MEATPEDPPREWYVTEGGQEEKYRVFELEAHSANLSIQGCRAASCRAMLQMHNKPKLLDAFYKDSHSSRLS